MVECTEQNGRIYRIKQRNEQKRIEEYTEYIERYQKQDIHNKMLDINGRMYRKNLYDIYNKIIDI